MRKHKPVPRSRWQASQKRLLSRWKKKNLKLERAKAELMLLPLLLQQAREYPDDGSVLEVGCGPVCIAQQLPQKHKTFLDPLIDDFRRMFPGELPEDGEHLATEAERIKKDNCSYDLIVCLNTLSFSLNPELVINEIERLLKPGGTFVLQMRTHSHFEAWLHYWSLKLLPQLARGTRPYYYSLRGIRNTLKRHFTIKEEQQLGKSLRWLPLLKRERRIFICTPLNSKQAKS